MTLEQTGCGHLLLGLVLDAQDLEGSQPLIQLLTVLLEKEDPFNILKVPSLESLVQIKCVFFLILLQVVYHMV